MQTTSTRRALWIALASITTSVFASHMARAIDVDRQPLAAQAARLSEALTSLGQPLPAETADALQAALSLDDDAEAVAAIQTVLDPLCLVTVEINPESRVKATAGPAPKKLVQQGWTVLLVKVLNEAGITAALEATSPNAAKIVGPSSGSPIRRQGSPMRKWPIAGPTSVCSTNGR